MKGFLIKSLATLCIAFFCSSARAAEPCDPLQIELITTPAPPASLVSLKAYQNTLIPGDADLVVVGDSIANQLYHGITTLGGKARSPMLLAGGGDGFQQALFKLNHFEPALRRVSPEKVLIVLGTNNMHMSACALEAGFKRYIHKIKEIWPASSYYVLQILPRGDLFESNQVIDDYNNFIHLNENLIGYHSIGLNEDDLTCGARRAAEYKSLVSYSNSDQRQKRCPLVIHAGSGFTTQCKISLKVQCTNFAPDNVHLSSAGIAYVSKAIMATLDGF